MLVSQSVLTYLAQWLTLPWLSFPWTLLQTCMDVNPISVGDHLTISGMSLHLFCDVSQHLLDWLGPMFVQTSMAPASESLYIWWSPDFFFFNSSATIHFLKYILDWYLWYLVAWKQHFSQRHEVEGPKHTRYFPFAQVVVVCPALLAVVGPCRQLFGWLSMENWQKSLSVREITLMGCSAKQISVREEKWIKKGKVPWACCFSAVSS